MRDGGTISRRCVGTHVRHRWRRGESHQWLPEAPAFAEGEAPSVPPPESAAFAGTPGCAANGTEALDCAPALEPPRAADPPTAPTAAGAAEAAPWALAAACAD